MGLPFQAPSRPDFLVLLKLQLKLALALSGVAVIEATGSRHCGQQFLTLAAQALQMACCNFGRSTGPG